METVKRFFTKSSPLVKMLMAVSLTSGIVAINKLYYAPYKRRMKHLQAEEWASHIIEHEEREKNH